MIPTPAAVVDPLLRQRTLIALRIAQRDVACAAQPGANCEYPATITDTITTARLYGLLARRLTCMSVIAARLVYDLPWSDIAACTGHPAGQDAALHYEEQVARWIAGDPAPWAPHVPGMTVDGTFPIDITAENVETVAAQVKAKNDEL